MVENERLYSSVNISSNDNLKSADPLSEDSVSKGTNGASLDSQNNGENITSSVTEIDKFNNLCDGVLTAHAMFDMCLTEVLATKDELLKYSLPSNLLVSLTVTCSKLYRSASDLSVPTNELVRLVRLYSAQWEAKSNVLKKLHDDYESKQRRLEIALKKLELVGVASQRIEKEKRIMNWEKVFAKVMGAKSHGHRWKFLINSLKEKVKSGEILSIPFPANSTDDELNDDKTFVPRHHRKNAKSLRHQSILRREMKKGRGNPTGNGHQSNEAESEMSSEEDELKRIRKMANDRDSKLNITSSRFKSRYPFDREDRTQRFKADRVESPTGLRNFSSPKSTGTSRRFIGKRIDEKSKNVSFFDESTEETKTSTVKKEDKCVWTGETQYDRYLHVRVYKPDSKKVPESVCTVCFGDQVFSSSVFGIEEDTKEPVARPSENKSMKKLHSKENLIKKNNFQEFVFVLPEGRTDEKGKLVLKSEPSQLRVAVQPGKGKPMAGMCTVEYNHLDIQEKDPTKDDLSNLEPVSHPLLSLASDKETTFNSKIGHIPLACYQTRKERLLYHNESTQTLSIQQLFDEMLEAKRIEEEEINQLNEEPEKMYTEMEWQKLKKSHEDEMEFIRNDYEFQLQELFRASYRSSPDNLTAEPPELKLVNASTSPIPRKLTSPSPAASPRTQQRPRPRTADARPSPRRGKKIKTTQALPEWGKDLPANFFDRLEQFSQASAKYHQQLSEKTRKAVQENYELQMATQNRINIADDEIDLNDVCLPALFMPSRTGTVYSPKASLYFHPSGVSSRFTQPPSVFKLPFVAERDRSSVMNLFDLGQNFLHSGPTWLSQNARPRSASPTSPSKNTFPVQSQEICAILKNE